MTNNIWGHFLEYKTSKVDKFYLMTAFIVGVQVQNKKSVSSMK